MYNTLDTMLTQCDTAKNGNTDGILRCRKWCFTLNNYTRVELSTLTQVFENDKYIFQEETGVEGTVHLQGFVEFKNARSLTSLKKINGRIHWEKTRNDTASINYCQKQESRTGKTYSNFIPVFKTIETEQLYPWQRMVIDIINTNPDDRTIHWFWEPNGCTGKTALAKYILKNYYNAQYSCATKSADILTIADCTKNIYILNFSRCIEGFMPWVALEQLKDGLISDSKLKKRSNNIIMDSPHVICFANWPPCTDKLSNDRWNIVRIDHDFVNSNGSKYCT